MTDNIDILVLAEYKNKELASVSAEVIGVGRKLADELGVKLNAVIIGNGVSSLGAAAVSLGADKVYTIDNPLLENYQADSFLTAIEKLTTEINPAIIILGQTATGRELTARLAFRLKTAAALDCVKLVIDKDSGRLLATRPVYGGNALADVMIDSNPQVVAIRAKAFAPAEVDSSRQGEIVSFNTGIDAATNRTKLLDKVVKEVEGITIEDARVVVGGGRGIGSAEGFKELEELSTLLGGAVGASRPPCDNGWAAETLQIGITGKIIAPELYFAVALSGSSQHISGISGSKAIVAINKDAEANIFNAASYGIVGDWKKVIPALAAKIKELG
jgi:electron transfer flavoprotein alpha subunit